MKKITWFLWIASSLLLAACGGTTTQENSPISTEAISGNKIAVSGGEYIDINADQLQDMLKNKDFVFVNVHIPFEGDIAHTDLSIPYDEIDQHLDKLPAEKDARIVLYCRSDRMSTIAAETLVGLGYTNVANLDGGMVAWEQAGLPIEGN